MFVKEKTKNYYVTCYTKRAITKMHNRSRDGNHTELIFITTAAVNDLELQMITDIERSNIHSNFCDESILEDYV